MGNVNMEASQINYRGGEKKMSVEEALKNTSGEAAAIAQLQTDVLNLNSNKANQITIVLFFSAEASYEVGDLVYYNGLIYRCTNAHEGEWDADDFAATTIAGELDALKSGLTNIVRLSKTYNNVSIPSSGYVELDSMAAFPVEYQGYTLLSIVILGSNYLYTNPLSITRGGDGGTIYALGSEQTVSSITIGYVLCDNVTNVNLT